MRWRMKEKDDGMGVVKEMMEKYSGRVKGAGKGRGKKVTVTAIRKGEREERPQMKYIYLLTKAPTIKSNR